MNEKELLVLAQAALLGALTEVPAARLHFEECPAVRFAVMNKHLPGNHPAWAKQPECTCWVSKAAQFLKAYRP